MKKLLTLIFLSVLTSSITGQTIKSTGTAQVRMESYMTEGETREKAEELAIIDAIEDAFGTYAEQQMDMTIKDGNTHYNIYGGTKVRGEWIETLEKSYREDLKKEKSEYGITNIKYITCVIKGKVRKSVPKAQLDYEILNHPDIHARTNSFYHEEQLYVFFKSPVNGYLSIFLEDDDAVYRLLPYINMRDEYQSGVPVKSDSDYLFFSPESNAYPGNTVDEQLILSLKDDTEYNNIYIVFSEDEFAKPMLSEVTLNKGRIIPKQLTKERFRQWLESNRHMSDNFQDIRTKIKIEPRSH